ncbi:MAG: serine/threonine protein kinase, partial [Chloroflexi bacterium]
MSNNFDNLNGKTLGTCILENLIGQGGMGAVYLARQIRPSRHVAVKVLLSNVTTNSSLYKEFLVRFRHEADVVARLEQINIMAIYEYGEQDGIAYLVMPYFPGGSLRDLLARNSALSLQEAATFIDQAAAALDFAHAHGVIHRDLKPGNFLLSSDGRLVLADFGIARMLWDSDSTFRAALTGTGAFLGTPEYMAPEMLNGEPIDHRADIYALGIVL